MKLFTIFCENRNSYYVATSMNDVTIWSKDLDDASRFNNLENANKMILEFKNSAMGDTKYLIAREIEISVTLVDNKMVREIPQFKGTLKALDILCDIKIITDDYAKYQSDDWVNAQKDACLDINGDENGKSILDNLNTKTK